MSYEKTIWVNDNEPSINEDNLNKIEEGIYDAHKAIESLTTVTIKRWNESADAAEEEGE